MVGNAVATIVWSRAAISMPSRTATKMKLRRCGSTATLPGGGSEAWPAGAAAGVALVMPAFPRRSMVMSAHGQPVATKTAVGAARRRSAGRPRHALRRVQLHAQLVHQLQLRLEVVDVRILVGHDGLEE